MAGWLFSLWSGPVPIFDSERGTIVGNSSVKFSLIDLVAKFTNRYEWPELVVGVLTYIGLIGIVSYISYFLLIKFNFILVEKKSHDVEDLSFDLNEQDEILTGKFNNNNFFGIWLKLAPIILFVFLTIAVISQEAFKENGDKLQDLFDSLTNQAMGQLSAFAITGILYLYIIKIIEPRYLYKTNDANNETGNIILSWEIIMIIVLFIVMLLFMIFTHSFPSTTGVYFISYSAIGYIIFCFSTGFSISFGLRFIGLDLAQNKLLNHLIICTNLINKLSKPRRDIYIDNQIFNQGIAVIQHQMLKLIAKRNELAHKLTSEKNTDKKESIQKAMIFPMLPELNHLNHEDSNEGNTHGKESQLKERVIDEKKNIQHSLFEKLKYWFIENWAEINKKNGDNQKSFESQNPVREMFPEEVAYFPAFTFQINELNFQIQERINLIKDIDEHLDCYWVDEGNFKIINQQILDLQEGITDLDSKKNEFILKINSMKNKISNDTYRQETLIREGYLTGRWFLKENGDIYFPLTT